jgi:transcriptional regulator with XRE-family HTH domain
LESIGDHIKKTRIDLKLTQRELAGRLGVIKDTIRFWEKNQAEPSLVKIPKIVEFLGYDPFEKETESLGARIREYRRVHGLSQKKLAEQLGIDQKTLAGWERREHRLSRSLLDRLSKLGIFSD